jgi:hypothetical protein
MENDETRNRSEGHCSACRMCSDRAERSCATHANARAEAARLVEVERDISVLDNALKKRVNSL